MHNMQLMMMIYRLISLLFFSWNNDLIMVLQNRPQFNFLRNEFLFDFLAYWMHQYFSSSIVRCAGEQLNLADVMRGTDALIQFSMIEMKIRICFYAEKENKHTHQHEWQLKGVLFLLVWCFPSRSGGLGRFAILISERLFRLTHSFRWILKWMKWKENELKLICGPVFACTLASIMSIRFVCA